MSIPDRQPSLIQFGLTRREEGRPGREQPVHVAFHWDQLPKLVEGGRYGDSQQVLAVEWSAAVVGKETEIVVSWPSPTVLVVFVRLDKNKHERDTDFGLEVLDKEAVFG